MGMEDLVSRNHSFEICLHDIYVKPDDLEKITDAWSIGHFVFWNVTGDDFQNIYIVVFTVNSKSRAGKEAMEITRNWRSIKKMLEKNEIPGEWVDKAISIVCKRMEELV